MLKIRGFFFAKRYLTEDYDALAPVVDSYNKRFDARHSKNKTAILTLDSMRMAVAQRLALFQLANVFKHLLDLVSSQILDFILQSIVKNFSVLCAFHCRSH